MDQYDDVTTLSREAALVPGVDLTMWLTLFIMGLLAALTVTVVTVSLA